MNILLPSYDFNVVTLGMGYILGDLAVDLGFELLLGDRRTVGLINWYNNPEYKSAMPGKYGMTMFVPNMSVHYRF